MADKEQASQKHDSSAPRPEFLQYWTKVNSYVLVAALTVACLLPFANRAFHVDDPLFLWAAKQIVKSPGNPYGFDLIWDFTRVHMSDVTQNPPLAAYYAAEIGKLAGWEERPMHLGFLIVAVLLVLGTYRLAAKFTEFPLLATLATLLTPGVLVSATSVMCDIMMLALWVWAMALWMEGLEPERPGRLVLSALLMSAAFLTKYFAVSLILLMFVYSVMRLRRVGRWAVLLLFPLATIGAYQWWTAALYGQGLLTRAGTYAEQMRGYFHPSWTAHGLMALSFTGGCALVPLLLAPMLWSRWKSLVALAVSAIGAAALLRGWASIGRTIGGAETLGVWKQHAILLGVQWTLFFAGGIAVLALMVSDVRAAKSGEARASSAEREATEKRIGKNQRKERAEKKAVRESAGVVDFAAASMADSWLLALWVLGTFIFAGFVNWTVNARSVLPLIPAAAILLTRQMARRFDLRTKNAMGIAALALLASGAISVWVTMGDTELADTARRTALLAYQKVYGRGGRVWFEGHWGFQYYMELLGGQPLDLKNPQATDGDVIVIPFNNVWTGEPLPYKVSSEDRIFLPVHTGATTISWPLGAAFYSTYWGPMPYAIGPEPLEGARILRIGEAPGTAHP